MVVDDGQTVDGDAGGDGIVAGGLDVAAVVVGAVAADIDDAAGGFDTAFSASLATKAWAVSASRMTIQSTTVFTS